MVLIQLKTSLSNYYLVLGCSTLLYLVSLLSVDDHHRNPNNNTEIIRKLSCFKDSFLSPVKAELRTPHDATGCFKPDGVRVRDKIKRVLPISLSYGTSWFPISKDGHRRAATKTSG